MRGRSQSVILPRTSPPILLRTTSSPSHPPRSRSRPTSPTTKRPPSRAGVGPAGSKTPKKKKARAKSAHKASTSSFEIANDDQISLPPVNTGQKSSPFKKKPLKRIRRPRKGSQNHENPWNDLVMELLFNIECFVFWMVIQSYDKETTKRVLMLERARSARYSLSAFRFWLLS